MNTREADGGLLSPRLDSSRVSGEAANGEEAEALLPRVDEHDAGIKARAQQAFRAFLCFSLAVEVFSVVCQGLFLPIALEQYARDNGRLAPDHSQPCIVSGSGPGLPGSNPAIPGSDPGGGVPDLPNGRIGELRCDTLFFGSWIDSASFSLYTFSISVALQALLVITLGAAADDPVFRRRLMALTSTIGGISSILFFLLPSSSPIWFMASPLAMSGNVSFGLAMVALNAYLPAIARGLAESTEPADIAKATARVSARGIATGYSSGCILLSLSLIPVLLTKGSTLGMRIAVGITGAWWLTLATVAVRLMPLSIFPLLQKKVIEGKDDFWAGWRGLGVMLKEMPRLPEAFKYLLAWLLLSDAFTTVTSTAVLYGKTVLHMGAPSLVIVGVISPAAGIAGALLSPRLARRFGFSNHQTLVLLVVLATLVPLYGCLGLVPFIQRLGIGGINTSAEMYVIAIYFGAVYGGFQSFSRAVFSSLIPANHSARWFGLYSITDKSASFVGPLVVGLIADWTGSLRLSFVFLVASLATPLPILAFLLNVEKGRLEAEIYDAT